jgi:site-specific DNA recombinase
MRTAAYARYSSDQQSAASLDDQLRNIRAFCQRHGWGEPVVYRDAAISGARTDRPGYQALLRDAHRFDVILVDDLSRLSRDSIEAQQQVKRLTFAGVRLVGVSDGVDTGRKGHKAEVGLRGIMGEIYLDDLRDKTHRGLTGRALAGASAGGLPYGYRVTEVGQRAIDETQAAIVRRIFAEYIAGTTPRMIAAGLNRDGIPSARGTQWVMSAIYGDTRRGIGILANPIYAGVQIWNRSQWIKHPDTGRRVRQERPESDWIRTEHPELAIIDGPTWAAAQARMRRRGAPAKGKGGPGRPAAHLLSGLLRCGACGGPLVVINHYSYGCSAMKNRGTCSEGLFVSRRRVETALLDSIQNDLLSEQAYDKFQRDASAVLKRSAPDTDGARRRLLKAEEVHGNVMAAIRAGIITASTKAELLSAEAEIVRRKAELERLRQFQPAHFLPRARETWNRIVAIRELLGENIVIRKENGDLIAEIAASTDAINMVAGAGSVLYLTEPVRIPLT